MGGARLRPSPPSVTKRTSCIFLVQVGRVGVGVVGRARLEVTEITEGLRLHGNGLVPQTVALCRRRRKLEEPEPAEPAEPLKAVP